MDDIGSAMVGTGTIDFFKPSNPGNESLGRAQGDHRAYQVSSPEKSLEILMPRKKSRHVREMVEVCLLSGPREISGLFLVQRQNLVAGQTSAR